VRPFPRPCYAQNQQPVDALFLSAQKTASTKTRIIKWLITETDAVLSQINSLHASLKQDAVEAVANRLEVCDVLLPINASWKRLRGGFVQSVPLILQDLATSCDSELDIALNHVRATALIRSEGAASTDQSSPLVENLLIAQRKHDVNGPMKVWVPGLFLWLEGSYSH
jgi:hypothetical protein